MDMEEAALIGLVQTRQMEWDALSKQIEELKAKLRGKGAGAIRRRYLNGDWEASPKPRKARRKPVISAAGKARISEAKRKWWAEKKAAAANLQAKPTIRTGKAKRKRGRPRKKAARPQAAA